MKYILTGSSSGLGFCLTKRLVELGKVAGISRTIGKSTVLIDNKNFSHLEFDLSSSSDENEFRLFSEKLKLFLKDDPFVLILNAARFYVDDKRMTSAELSNLFEVNVFSLFKIVKLLENYSLKRIFIINSISGLIGQPDQHEYSASKHAIMGFVKSLTKNAKNKKYDVMCINPGGMSTELWSDYKNVNTEDFLNPENIADLCINLIQFPQKVFIESMSILPPSDI